MQGIEPRITDEVFSVLGIDKSVASRASYGGTAPANVREQAQKWLDRLAPAGNRAATSSAIPSH
jgi:argininosuccinate lyase